MKETIKIDKFEPKISKDGKSYAMINNKYTCHEKEFLRTFEDNMGKVFDIEVVDSADGKWHNIRKLYGEGSVDEVNIIPMNPTKKTETKEYHLTIEQQRVSAVDLALKTPKSNETFWEVVEKYFKYINTGE